MGVPGISDVSRRNLLVWTGGAGLVTASLSGCGFFSTEAQNADGSQNNGQGGDTATKESPMLQEQVAAGKLDPLESRLPKNPLIVEVPQPGAYGGTWHSVFLGPGDEGGIDRIAGYQPLLRKDVMCVEIVPNLCTDIEVSDDGTEFTLLLREGIRWSDGEPFTAADVVFAMTDVFGNTDLYPTPPGWLSQDGELARAEQIDDTTVKVIFPDSNGLFRETAAQSMDLVRFPKHFAAQFLPKYNDDLDKEVKKTDFESWSDLFFEQTSMWGSVDLPVLTAWQVTKPLGEGNQVVLERNPYFWKTDPDGRQLPYIDTMSFDVVLDPQVQVLKGTSGDLDMVNRLVNTPANKPVFAKSREQNDYRLVDTKSTWMNTMCIGLNLANKNAEHRRLYQKKDFRIGLSHAIDRKELITSVWQRQGEPWQAAPTEESIYYDEEFAHQYLAYDTKLAEDHLDKAGVVDRDEDGFRTLPSGKKLTITLDIASAVAEEWQSAGSIIEQMWKEVGIRLKLNILDRTLYSERQRADTNEHDAAVWYGPGGSIDEVVDPRWYLAFGAASVWGTPWALWCTSRGTSGTEPIPAAKKQIELFWELQGTPDQQAREDLFREILTIAKEEFWVLGIGSYPDPYMVVSNRLKNVVADMPDSWTFRTPAHGNPEMWHLGQGGE